MNELVKCPFCEKEIEADSFYCDQCGQELKTCPAGHGFKKGKICAQCGKPLTPAKEEASTVQNPTPQSTGPGYLVNKTLNARLPLIDGAIIGRKTGNYTHIFGSQGYVSGTHAQLRKHGADGWEIMDMNSTNGTFLNDVRLTPLQSSLFKVGDTIAFYDLKFTVE